MKQLKTLIKKIKVEVAKTPSQITTGLMYRKNMDPDSGMLFVFDKKSSLSFWGLNTYIALDLAFIDDDKIIDIKEIVPLSTKAVKCDKQCKYALEMPLNFFSNNKIKIGSLVYIQGDEISFFEK